MPVGASTGLSRIVWDFVVGYDESIYVYVDVLIIKYP